MRVWRIIQKFATERFEAFVLDGRKCALFVQWRDGRGEDYSSTDGLELGEQHTADSLRGGASWEWAGRGILGAASLPGL